MIFLSLNLYVNPFPVYKYFLYVNSEPDLFSAVKICYKKLLRYNYCKFVPRIACVSSALNTVKFVLL
jgi:hypothetical protein